MIYKNSYFQKELRHAYIENSISSKRKNAFAILAGLVSFAVHFFMRTMSGSVLGDMFPQFIQTSYFSTLYTYVTVAFFLYVLYFIIYYEYLSFVEIRKNRWYLLTKMGYSPLSMIFSKLLAFLYSVWMMYSGGFLFTIGLTLLIKYTFIHEYMPALYIAGLIDILVIGIVSITSSLYIRDTKNARYFIFIFTIVLLVVKSVTGYFTLTSDRIMMQNALNLVDSSQAKYLLFSAAIVFVCTLICVFKAQSVAKYYNMPEETYGYVIPEGTSVFKIADPAKKIHLLTHKEKSVASNNIIDFAITALFVGIICITLVVNAFILISSATQPGKEITIFNVVPYVFQSNTMEPHIMENDLAYFRRIDHIEPINIGDIVLFQDNKVVYVERVNAEENGQYTVDIDNYPPMSQVGAMKKTISREAIYGIYTHRNRWLGVLILSANTVFGRFVLLLVPAVILFFYNPIRIFVINLIHFIRTSSEAPD